MHGHHDASGDDALGEGDELGGDAAKDDARIGAGRRGGELSDGCGDLDRRAAVHGVVEEGVLGADVAEEGGGSHAELAGDVGERGGGEALRGEDAAGDVEDLVAGDAGRPAHL